MAKKDQADISHNNGSVKTFRKLYMRVYRIDPEAAKYLTLTRQEYQLDKKIADLNNVSYSCMVYGLFGWARTTQGFQYWQDIQHALEAKEKGKRL